MYKLIYVDCKYTIFWRIKDEIWCKVIEIDERDDLITRMLAKIIRIGYPHYIKVERKYWFSYYLPYCYFFDDPEIVKDLNYYLATRESRT